VKRRLPNDIRRMPIVASSVGFSPRLRGATQGFPAFAAKVLPRNLSQVYISLLGSLCILAAFKRSFSMPVLECSCGMVMSTAARDARQRCIRCGGGALRELSGGTAVLPALWRFMNSPAMDVAFQPTSGKQNRWATETIGEGSHI
jgi:hypothetical protein